MGALIHAEQSVQVRFNLVAYLANRRRLFGVERLAFIMREGSVETIKLATCSFDEGESIGNGHRLRRF